MIAKCECENQLLEFRMVGVSHPNMYGWADTAGGIIKCHVLQVFGPYMDSR